MGVFIIRPKIGPGSKKKSKTYAFEKCGYLTGPFPKDFKFLVSDLSHFMLFFDDEISV